MAWGASVGYLAYALAPVKIYYDGALTPPQVLMVIFFSVVCIFLSFFLMGAYPSAKTIQGLNGKMLKVEGSKYIDR